MEMPEGLQRLDSDKGPGLNDSSLAFDISYAVGLLKEMAEALDDTLDTIHGEFCGQSCHILHSVPAEALKKFREWK